MNKRRNSQTQMRLAVSLSNPGICKKQNFRQGNGSSMRIWQARMAARAV